MELLPIIRWLHVISAAAWLGEVVVINFVLIPALSRFDRDGRKLFLVKLFPRVFRLASVLSGTTAITGGFLLYHYTGGQFSVLLNNMWGICMLVGGGLGLLLTIFHFFIENRLGKKINVIRHSGSDAVFREVYLDIKIVPRLGLLVITTIFFLMMYAVRGM